MTAQLRWQATQLQQRQVLVQQVRWDLQTAKHPAILLELKLQTRQVSIQLFRQII